MGGRKYRKTIYAVTAALIMSTCTMPVMAAPYSTSDKTLTAVSSDQTYAQGTNTEARIITSVELDKRSPYVNTGIAVTDTYLNIYQKASKKSDVVGKLNNGSGCEVIDSTDSWYHIKSGKCEGYVAKKSVITGYDAQQYAQAHNITGLVAKSQDENSKEYLYKEPSSDSDIVTTVMWDQDVNIIGETDDHSWVQVKVGKDEGYIPSSSVILDVKYEEAVAVQPETEKAAAQVTAAAKAKTETQTETQKETQAQTETQKETQAQTETQKETEKETQKETEAAVKITDADETVYATYSVSIRDGYSTDSNIIGCLAGGDSIKRTGVCDNGWSRVDFNGKTAYIKSDYLTTDKPAETETETKTKTEAPAASGTVYATEGVNIREAASSDADIIGALNKGDSVTCVSTSGDWSCIQINGVTGYVKSEYLTSEKPAAAETEKETAKETAKETKAETTAQTEKETQAETDGSTVVKELNETVYATSGVNVRKSASKDSAKLGSLAEGESVTRTGKTANGWSRVSVNGTTGYVNSNYLTTEKPVVTTSSSTTAVSSGDSSSLGSQIASFAQRYLGNPYVYGGNSLTNGVDCSGFTQQVYLHFGYSIPRTADSQAGVGTAVSVSTSTLQPGDLLFYGSSSYIGHVAIYIGNGEVIHASTPTKGIIITKYNYRTPVCARRII